MGSSEYGGLRERDSDVASSSAWRYIAMANERLEQCIAAAGVRPVPGRGAGSRSARLNYVCGSGAETGLAVLYDEAKGEVGFERETSMYLKRYQHEWTEVMTLLATREWRVGEQRERLQQRLADLEQIEGKLRR